MAEPMTDDPQREITITLRAFEWDILQASLTERRDRIAKHRVSDEYGIKTSLLAGYDEIAEKLKGASDE
jgi:phage gp16-like protein